MEQNTEVRDRYFKELSIQLMEMYRCVKETLDMDFPMADKRAELLEKVCEQIERSVPNLEERVGQSQNLDGEVADAFEFGQTMY